MSDTWTLEDMMMGIDIATEPDETVALLPHEQFYFMYFEIGTRLHQRLTMCIELHKVKSFKHCGIKYHLSEGLGL